MGYTIMAKNKGEKRASRWDRAIYERRDDIRIAIENLKESKNINKYGMKWTFKIAKVPDIEPRKRHKPLFSGLFSMKKRRR